MALTSNISTCPSASTQIDITGLTRRVRAPVDMARSSRASDELDERIIRNLSIFAEVYLVIISLLIETTKLGPCKLRRATLQSPFVNESGYSWVYNGGLESSRCNIGEALAAKLRCQPS
jgi:hypothetical protein